MVEGAVRYIEQKVFVRYNCYYGRMYAVRCLKFRICLCVVSLEDVRYMLEKNKNQWCGKKSDTISVSIFQHY